MCVVSSCGLGVIVMLGLVWNIKMKDGFYARDKGCLGSIGEKREREINRSIRGAWYTYAWSGMGISPQGMRVRSCPCAEESGQFQLRKSERGG